MLELTVFQVDEDHWDIVVTDESGNTSTHEQFETAGVGIDEIIMQNPEERMIVTIAPLVE
jgi:hypothetical protein